MDTNLKHSFDRRNLLIVLILIGAVIGCLPVFGVLKGENGTNTANSEQILDELDGKLIILQDNSLLPVSVPNSSGNEVIGRIKVIATAYSSTVWQTDSNPFITAAGTCVRDGVIANNYLAIGTKIRIPELYGQKIFVVEDRMNKKMDNYQIDIWFSSYRQALNFGAKNTYIEILES